MRAMHGNRLYPRWASVPTGGLRESADVAHYAYALDPTPDRDYLLELAAAVYEEIAWREGR